MRTIGIIIWRCAPAHTLFGYLTVYLCNIQYISAYVSRSESTWRKCRGVGLNYCVMCVCICTTFWSMTLRWDRRRHNDHQRSRLLKFYWTDTRAMEMDHVIGISAVNVKADTETVPGEWNRLDSLLCFNPSKPISLRHPSKQRQRALQWEPTYVYGYGYFVYT